MLARFQYAGVLATLIVLGGLSLAQSGPTNSLDELLRQGQEEMAAKEWEAAETTFRQALQADPENVSACAGLGRCLYQMERFQDALASFSKLLELAPTNSAAQYQLASCHYKLHDFQRAANSFQRFLAADPNDAEGYYWLSRSLSALRRQIEAERAICKAIALGAAPAHYYDQWGYCLAELKRYHEAITALKKALELDATDTYALLRLGACYYDSNAYREAVAPLEKYVAAKPKDFYGFYYLGHSHFELFQFGQAAPALQKAHELNPDDVLTRLGLFVSCLATARYEQALGLYPFTSKFVGGVLVFGYAIGLAWMLVWSFKTRISLVPPILATFPGCAPPLPPKLGDCQPIPPLLPNSVPPLLVTAACCSTGSEVGRCVSTAPQACEDIRSVPVVTATDGAVKSSPPIISPADDLSNTPTNATLAIACPGMLFCLGWLALFIGGQLACAFLLGSFAPFRGVAALLAGMGAASLPLVIAAGVAFPRQPWGSPFAWPRPFPPARLLMLALLGLISVPLFEAGYSKLVEWITRNPFPVQITLPLIQELLRTNPVSVVVSVVFLAPMAEEVLFRGLLFGALQKWFSARSAILATAALFALIHMQAAYFIPLFWVGLLCGWARHKSGSLAVPMMIHVLNNGISLALIQFFPEAT